MEPKFHDLEINGLKIFNDMKPYVVNRLAGILSSKYCRWDPKIFQASIKLVIRQGISKPHHFCCLLEYVYRSYLQEKDEAIGKGYRWELVEVKRRKDTQFLKCTNTNMRFSLVEFQRFYLGGEKLFSRRKALYEVGTDDAVKDMNKRFNEAKVSAWNLSHDLEVGFSDEYTAAYHAILHKKWGQTVIYLEAYFMIVKVYLPLRKSSPSLMVWINMETTYFECYNASDEAFGVIYHFFNESSHRKIVSTVHRKSKDVI